MITADDVLPLMHTVVATDHEDVARTVREAGKTGTPVYPIGGGTSLDCGLPPRRPGIGLSLAGLTRVVDYPARDMTITVEAGIRLDQLAATMAAEGQWLPVDAAESRQATLGGLIATNFSGPRRFGHGTIRDYVIGISAVDGRGTAFKAGGRVVKNVAGYDFCKLLTGSFGTLAVITQVTLKARPLPERSAFFVARPTDLAQADMLLEQFVRSEVTPVAIELVAGSAWDGVLPGDPRGIAIVVGLEGTSREVDWMLDQLEQEWQSQGIRGFRLVEPDPVNTLWSALIEFPADRQAALSVKANLLPSATVRFVREVLDFEPRATVQAHAGDGIVIARFAELPAARLSGAMIKRLQPAARKAQGNAVVLRAASGSELTHQVVWGPPRGDADLMQAVKRQFDPHGILNPGRFVYYD